MDSTKLVEELGDLRAAEIFASVDRLTRDLLVQYDGLEIDRTDGFLLAFERPVAAVRFALATHEALEAAAAEQGRSLQVRAGIHTGEVVLRRNAPEDVARGAKPLEVEGLAKPFAARIMSAAHGGQTLMSQTAHDMARRASVGEAELVDLTWADHGRWLIKGMADPVPLFEVTRGSPRAPKGGSKVRRATRGLRRWLAAAGGLAAVLVVGLIMAGFGAWWWLTPALDHDTLIFTVEGAPTLYDDPVQQRRLERVWEAFLEDDGFRSSHDFHELIESEQVPAELVPIALSAHYELGLQPDQLLQMLRRVPSAEDKSSGARVCAEWLAEGFRMMHTDVHPTAAMLQYGALTLRTKLALDRWLDAHPDDALAIACLHNTTRGLDPEGNLARIEAGDPDGNTPRLVVQRAATLQMLGREDEATDVILTAKQSRPDSVALDIGLAMIHRLEGRLDEAQEILEGWLVEQPERPELRILAAVTVLELDDEERFAEHFDVLVGPQWHAGVRITTMTTLLKPLHRAGRPELAYSLLPEGDIDYQVYSDLLFYAQIPGYMTLEQTERPLEILRRASAPRGLPTATQRDAARNYLAALECYRALYEGEGLEPACDEAVYAWPYAPTKVAAFRQGELGPLEKKLEDDDASGSRDAACATRFNLAAYRRLSGQVDRALVDMKAFLEREDCSGPAQRAMRAIAAGELALAAFERDDREEARRYVSIYQAVWPTAEADLDIARRLAAYGVTTGPARERP